MASTATTNASNSSNFFNTTIHEEQYWEQYLAARPKYSPDFYKLLLDYHRSHQSTSSPESDAVAHDVGTGPGQVAAVLAPHFSHIVASDLNETHLSVAAQRLQISDTDPSASKVTIKHLGAEALHTAYPASSASFIAAAECMALLDAEKALSSWHTVLKPGGTLAIWFYGRPHFVPSSAGDDFDAAACQALYNRIADIEFGRAIKNNAGPAHTFAWKRATDCMSSFLDNVAVSPAQWTDVQRTKWNPDYAMSFYGAEACDFAIEPASSIDAAEKVEEVRDPSFWAEDWSVEDWKLFLKMNLPAFKGQGEADNSLAERLWGELAEKMGGSGVKRTTGWPVVAILATKKA